MLGYGGLTMTVGPTVSQENMPLPTARYMYTEFLSNAEIEKMSSLPD